MPDLIKRGLQIIGGGVISYGKEYTSNLQTLKNDADTIRTSLMQSGKTAAETFSQMKSSGITKKLTNWFYQKGDEYDEFGNDTDSEFDPGFQIDSNDDEDTVSNNSAKILDAESMKDITKSQLNAMYSIGGKQAEVNIANTAEIVTSINNRSAEMIAAINNVNASLLGMAKKIDKLSEIYNTTSNSSNYNRNNTLIDSSGNLSLAAVFDQVKNKSTDNFYVSSAQMMLDTLKSGMIKPEDVVGSIIGMTIGEKKFKKLGDRSINEIGTLFDETVGAVVDTALSELVESKGFKKLFGNITSTEKDQNFGKLTPDTYNTKPAVFDGMTRHSIIHIIPEYLKKINEGITGQKYEIDHKGKLTTNPERGFDRVTRKAFSSSGLTSNFTGSVFNDVKAIDVNMNRNDVTEASKALTATYVMYLYHSGKTQLRASQLSANDISVIESAVRTLVYASGKPDSYWTPICMAILQRLSMSIVDASKFVANVNKSLANMIREATDKARNNVRGEQIGVITDDMMNDQFKQYHQEYYDRTTSSNNNNGNNSSTFVGRVRQRLQNTLGSSNDNRETSDRDRLDGSRGNPITPGDNPVTNNLTYSMLDYTRSIFGILNRGINVKITNPIDDLSGYPSYNISRTDVVAPIEIPQSQHISGNNDNVNVSEGDGKSFLSSMVDRLIPRSIRISMQHFASMLNPNRGNDNNGAETNETDSLQGTNESSSNKSPDTIGGKIHKLLQPTIDNVKRVSNKIIGEKTTDDEGNTYRQGGFVQDIRDKASSRISRARADIGSAVNSTLDDMLIKQEYKRVVSDVNNMRPKNDNDRLDQIKAQNVFALMQTSVADGDTTADISAINREISSISDPVLKNRLRDSVIPMLERSGQKAEKKKSSSIIGTLLKSTLSGLSKIISPVLTVLKTLFTGIKKIGSKIVSLMAKGIKSGASDIRSGVSNIGRAIFGTKTKYDENGNVIQQAPSSFSEGFKTPFNETKARKAAKANGTNEDGSTDISADNNEVLGEFSTNGSVNQESYYTSGTDSESIDEPQDENSTSEIEAMIAGSKESALSKLVSLAETIRDLISGRNNESGEESSGDNPFATDTESGSTTDVAVDNSADNNSVESSWGVSNNESSATTTSFEIESAPSSGSSSEVTDSSIESSSDVNINLGSSSSSSGTNSTTDSSASARSSGRGGASGRIGQLLGGIASTLGGIGKIILSIVAGMAGFQTLIKLVKQVVVKGLEPLNKAFTSITKAIKPILGTVQTMISTVAESVVKIVDSILPFIEIVQPVFEVLMDVLNPILETLTSLVTVIMAPLASVIEYTVVPVLQVIGGTLEVLLGIVETGIGYVMKALGSILTGVGWVVDKLTNNDKLITKGENLTSTGTELVLDGKASIKKGFSDIADSATSFFDTDDDSDEETKYEIPERKKEITPSESGGSVMDGIVASGDVTTTNNNINNIYNNTYGSGNQLNQNSYGPYMNMSERGCGPIALADAYSRRTGSSINPATLATKMNGSGAYNPNMGTSVGGFMNTSKALGMNVVAGGVTEQSLKYATPNNPITIIGSGSEYGTRAGNNHYVNVVGTDNHGGAYISNPLTGKVGRRSLSGIVSSSKMGLYGSGDSDDGLFSFDEGVTDALKSLQDITGNILGMFSTDTDSVESSKEKEKEKAAVKQAKNILGEEGYNSYEDQARQVFISANPKRDGESDDDYEQRFQNNKDKYMLKVVSKISKNTAMQNSEDRQLGLMATAESLLGKYDEESGTFTGGGFVDSLFNDSEEFKTSIASEKNNNTNTNTSGGRLTGSTNGEVIWNYFAGKGMSKYGIAGLMGNLYAESGLNPKNLQNTYETKLGYTDDSYTAAVDNGSYNNFVSDTAGYGLAQWTVSNRKKNLYNKIKSANTSVGDMLTQLNFLNDELNGDYASVRNVLDNATDIRTASDAVLLNFERPKDKGESVQQKRAKFGQDIYNQFSTLQPPTYVDSPIEAAAMVFEGYNDTYPSGGYKNYSVGSINLRDGTVIENLRPDCSGLMSAAIKYMGYGFSNGSGINNTGFTTYAFDNKTSNDVITDSSGNISDDWVIKPFDPSDRLPGDMVFTPGGSKDFPHSHVGMYVANVNGTARGFDGGSDKGISHSARAGKLYLNGDDYESSLAYTIQDNDNPRTILRFVGYNSPYDNPANNMSMTLNKVNSPGDDALLNGSSSNSVSAGSYVRIGDGATYYDGSAIPSWVLGKSWEVSSINGDRAILGKSKDYSTDGYNINSPINVKYLTGAGNTPSNDALSRFMNGLGNSSSSFEIPPLDTSDMSSFTGTYQDNNLIPTVINTYQYQYDETEKEKQLKRVLENTYNVRSERIERLLENILQKMDEYKNDKESKYSSSNNEGSNQSSKLFDDDRIPSSVTRLSRG